VRIEYGSYSRAIPAEISDETLAYILVGTRRDMAYEAAVNGAELLIGPEVCITEADNLFGDYYQYSWPACKLTGNLSEPCERLHLAAYRESHYDDEY
jgi:hypothetical protein